MSSTLTVPAIADSDQRFVLNAVCWKQYEAVLQAFGEHAGLRLIYVDGRMTLLSPSRPHDWPAEKLGQLVIALATVYRIEIEDSGHTTYRLEGLGAGVEGDKTYYFGANARMMRGPKNVDLTSRPPPDLAIEVENPHKANDALVVWGRFGVPEVWRLDVNRGTLVFGLRRDDGSYAPSSRSAAFPELEPSDVLEQLRLAESLGTTDWHLQIPDWVRTVLVPRQGRQPS